MAYSTKNEPNQFGIIIEFKHIAPSLRHNVEYHRERAEEGLRQIDDRAYASCLVGCLERLDIGMAIGTDVVSVVSQLYKRSDVDASWDPVD
ncbi:hypothetical protein GGF41_000739, partial [Coemansia sp. RSA 2531]